METVYHFPEIPDFYITVAHARSWRANRIEVLLQLLYSTHSEIIDR
jgi:hypothetical protein